MKLIISKIFPKAIMFIALVCLFISCEKDDAEPDSTWNWKAETIVNERDFVYNVYFSDSFTDEELSGRYQNCRFDKLTGWSQLCKTFHDIESNN